MLPTELKCSSFTYLKPLDVFRREKQVCEIFKSENASFKIHYNVNSEEIIITVSHKGNWNVEIGKKRLNELWRIFRLYQLGWETECIVFNYENSSKEIEICEYFFRTSINKQKNVVDLKHNNVPLY